MPDTKGEVSYNRALKALKLKLGNVGWILVKTKQAPDSRIGRIQKGSYRSEGWRCSQTESLFAVTVRTSLTSRNHSLTSLLLELKFYVPALELRLNLLGLLFDL